MMIKDNRTGSMRLTHQACTTALALAAVLGTISVSRSADATGKGDQRAPRPGHGLARYGVSHSEHGCFEPPGWHHGFDFFRPHFWDRENDFVRQVGGRLKENGREFRFAGSNNYYLPYASQFMVDDVLETADSEGFSVMRTWGGFDIGNQDGSNSVAGKANGVYFQYLNGTQPAYNDGADGLAHMDYVIAKAGELGIKMVIPFVNNWQDFGGMDQYVAWAGGQYHDQFYTDAKIRLWYKKWITHLLNHKNTLTGLSYKDDPTIMMWELANEPRCGGSGLYPRSPNCTTDTLTKWADEMSRFIKQVDNNHLVAVGDEGFFCDPSTGNWIDNCGEGVDSIALSSLRNVDVMSYHLYPDGWGQTVEWGREYIEHHIAEGLAIRKPAVLGEFGLVDQSTRNPNYKSYVDTVFDLGGAGALYWMLAGKQDNGTFYPDGDGFNVYCPSPVCTTISNFASEMDKDRLLAFSPVADNDIATTKAGVSVVLTPGVNDVSYGTSTVVGSSIDLDPATPGQQTSIDVAGGKFLLDAAAGAVTFTPAADFAGDAKANYTINDSAGRTSTPATLTVTVNPDPDAPLTLFSFETGTEGWAGTGGNPVDQSTNHATKGSHSLEIPAGAGGDWYGLNLPQSLNVGERVILEWDLFADAGTSQPFVLQTGDGWAWCQMGDWSWINGGQQITKSVNLKTATCDDGSKPDYTKIKAIWIWVSGGPNFIDNVRLKPDAGGPPVTVLHSFESGTEGFSGIQSSDWATDGSHSLMTNGGNWYSTSYSSPLNFSGKTQVSWDLNASAYGTGQKLMLQLGSGWDWCEGVDQWINAGTVGTITIALTTLSATCQTELSEVHALGIYMGNGGGPVYVDRIRVQ